MPLELLSASPPWEDQDQGIPTTQEEAGMSVLAIWTWSSRNEDVEDVRSALAALVEHCETEHPLIHRLGWYSAPAKDEASVEFRWLEEYESRETMARDEFTEVCEALWEPVKSRAVEGSFAGRAFDQGGLLER